MDDIDWSSVPNIEVSGVGSTYELPTIDWDVLNANTFDANAVDPSIWNSLIETADSPLDFPSSIEEVRTWDDIFATPGAVDIFFGGSGDQPGDFPTTEADLAAEDEMLGAMGEEQPLLGDQEGDFPLNEQERALADEELAQMPAAEEYADQPGDYDTTAEEVAASEEELAQIPDAQTDSNLNLKGVQDYFTNQYKNAFLKNLLGTSSGAMSRAIGSRYGIDTTPGLEGFSTDYEGDSGDISASSVAPTQRGDLTLFDPVSNASWAPQTKIGGLGFASKFINQEPDTYYLNPELAKRDKEAQDNTSFGWDAIDEGTEDPYYSYDEPGVEYAADGGVGRLPPAHCYYQIGILSGAVTT